MKKILLTMAAAGALALLAVLGGCGTQTSSDSSNLTSEKYAQINADMTTEQLKALAGEPSRTEAKNMSGGHSMGGDSISGDSMDMEYWYYQGSKGWVRFEIAGGKVTAKSGY